jgi:hypothetical protein
MAQLRAWHIGGYGAIIDAMQLQLPMPHAVAIISKSTNRYSTENWLVYTPRHQPKKHYFINLYLL